MQRHSRSYLEFWIVFCTGQLWAWLSFLNPLCPRILQLRPEVLADDLVPDLDIKGFGHLNKHVRIPRVYWDDVKFSVEFVPCRAPPWPQLSRTLDKCAGLQQRTSGHRRTKG